MFQISLLAQQTAEDFINEATTALKAKNYKDASTSLQFAITEINKLMVSSIGDKLPADINGFKMEKLNDDNAGTAGMSMMGGGLSISRKYTSSTDNSNYFEMNIVGNSPMIQSVSMMLNNPMFMAAAGANTKVLKLGSRKGLMKKESNDYDLQVPLNASLISIKGYGFKTDADFIATVNKIPFDDISKALGE